MKIKTTGQKKYILLNGINAKSDVKISENIILQPADTSHLDLQTALMACSSAKDIAVVAAFIPKISAQLSITAETSKDLAAISWNSFWDVLILSAVFNIEIGFHLCSDTTSSKIDARSSLSATNFNMHGMSSDSVYYLRSEDVKWVEKNLPEARKMLDHDSFSTSIHALASYRWHSHSRIGMAVVWAGIESMFGANTEIRFRLSLCIARFLHPTNSVLRKETFETVKKLYTSRSKAVHGQKIKGDLSKELVASSSLLNELIIRCIENGNMPDENELIP